MKAGDIQAEVTLAGEPSRLLLEWRANLRDTRPLSARLSIHGNARSFGDYEKAFPEITAEDKQLADFTLSSRSSSLPSDRLDAISTLHTILSKWIKNGERPAFDTACPWLRLTATVKGQAEAVISALERSTGKDLISRIQFKVWVLDHQPRRPTEYTPHFLSNRHDLPDLLESLRRTAPLMTPGQNEQCDALARRAANIFGDRPPDAYREHYKRKFASR